MKLVIRFVFIISILVTSCAPATTAVPAPGEKPTSSNIINPTTPACTTIAIAPTPGPENPSLFPPENAKDHARGAMDPLVIFMDYSDYQDPRSGLFADAVDRLLDEHPNDIRTVHRIFPLLSINDKAALAAQAGEAADEQGKFWEMRELLYSQQANWISLSVGDFEHWLTAQASGLGMNVDQFKSDLKREDIVAEVQQAWEQGQKIGLPGTPLILINGQIYGGPRDYSSLNDIVQLILLGKKQFATCPPVIVQTNDQYIATLRTEKGDIVIQLFADKAPITVNSFIFLARNGWYDNITFHRVLPDLYAQTGDPSGTGKGHPGYYILTEIDPSLTFNRPGMVAMVNSGPDTSGSQFFITYAPTAQFDGQYTIFGQVLGGMEVLEALAPRDAQPGIEIPPGNILIRTTIEER